jgi:hypothetical protein
LHEEHYPGDEGSDRQWRLLPPDVSAGNITHHAEEGFIVRAKVPVLANPSAALPKVQGPKDTQK